MFADEALKGFWDALETKREDLQDSFMYEVEDDYIGEYKLILHRNLLIFHF